MIPGTRFIASPHRLALLRLNAMLLWLAGFLFADEARAVVLGARGPGHWLGLVSTVLLTVSFGYRLNQRLGWINRALPPASDAEDAANQAV